MGQYRRSDDWFSHILEPAPQDVSLTIQMWGALLILQVPSTSIDHAHVSHVSENLEEVCGIPIDKVLHRPLSDICHPSHWINLIEQAQQKSKDDSDDIYAYAKVPLISDNRSINQSINQSNDQTVNVEVWMVMHASGPTLVCELLPIYEDDLNDPIWMDNKLSELQHLLSVPKDNIFQSSQTAISFINEVLQYDRCVLYLFGDNESYGEVIAENFASNNQHGLIPFLGHRFPSQKLTSEVSALYKKLKVRMIAEVFDFISLIISTDRPDQHLPTVDATNLPAAGHSERALDLLIHSVLRAATASHDEELVSMGVRNCLTAVLLVDGSLWGVVQCANINVRQFSWSHRLFLSRASDLLSTFISTTLNNKQQHEQELINEYCCHIALTNKVCDDRSLLQPLLSSQPDLVEMLQPNIGLVYTNNKTIFRFGVCPSIDEIKSLVAWVTSPQYQNQSYSSRQGIMDHLNAVQWPDNVANEVKDALKRRLLDQTIEWFCWEGLPPSLDHDTFPISKHGVLGFRSRHMSLFLFRHSPSQVDNEIVQQTLSTSILKNELVSDTVHRYSEGCDNFVQPWSLRQLVIFELLTSLLNSNLHSDDVSSHILQIRFALLQVLQLPGRLLLTSSQPQMILCKTNDVLQCLTANNECWRIFGRIMPHRSSTLPTHQSIENTDATDITSWFQEMGLNLSTIFIDGQQVVSQQSVWSKLKGRIKVTVTCCFLYGFKDDAHCESVYCLDIHDISMSSRVEDALVYAHGQLKNSERLKQDLIGTISHELRTPLAAIIGFQGVLREELGARMDVSENAQQCLDSIFTASEHLFSIVTDLLDLSKHEMTITKRSRVDLVSVVHEACQWETHKAAEKQMKIHFDVSQTSLSKTYSAYSCTLPIPRSGQLETRASSAFLQSDADDDVLTSLPMHVFGDTMSLKRIFVNLLDNAIKFSPAGSEISVSIRWVPSITTGQGGYINVVVEDQGIGIATENLSNIFRPFYQVDLTPQRKHQGIGLGLSIIRQIVELHEGRVSVRSKLGKGTRFDITFPTYDSRTREQRLSSLADTVTSPMESTQYPVLGLTSVAPPTTSRSTDTNIQQYVPTPHLPIPSTPRTRSRHMTSVPLNRAEASVCIMIVDDSSVNRRLLYRLLSIIGYSNIVEAQDGQEAIDTVVTLYAGSSSIVTSAPPVSLMFLDLHMPVMDGVSTLRNLRTKGFTFPIIAFTATNHEDIPSLSSAFDGFLAKPINRNVLQTILKEHLTR